MGNDVVTHTPPQLVVISGPNGAGKTTLAPFLLRDTFGLLEFVNADTISAGLSAFNPEGVAFDAGRLMLERLRELAKDEKGFAFESTLATRSYAPWISSLQKAGYEFHLVFLWLHTVDLAVGRVASRHRGGGHFVAPEVILRRYKRGLSNLFELYLPLADSWVVYDNSGTNTPLLVATGDKQGKQIIVRPDIWARLLEGQQ